MFLIMEKRDVILTAVFSSIAAMILLAGAAAAFYFFQKRRRKREEEEEEDAEGRRIAAENKKSRLNGFLSLKTPLISTKTLGSYSPKNIIIKQELLLFPFNLLQNTNGFNRIQFLIQLH
ncbi:hypothetical protein ABEB36_007636 [Hypothenemus hampei]|uniref:Uncharacterized protein n=1 Tax=Hypothenemus hampei TaxID=57062 RepID=A0ABD1EUN0_HYPHA